jgi:hypothetical protein
VYLHGVQAFRDVGEGFGGGGAFRRAPPSGSRIGSVGLKPLACSLALASICLALGPSWAAAQIIVPTELEPTRQELPGFASARVQPFWTTSAREWSQYSESTKAAATREEAQLTARGFQEGATVFFTGRKETRRLRREAVSGAFVFSTAQAAEQELRSIVAESLPLFPKRGLQRYTIPAIPGSVGLGSWPDHGKRGGTGNVYFSVGRCTIVVGDAFHTRSSKARVAHPATVAAIALYGRAKTACA